MSRREVERERDSRKRECKETKANKMLKEKLRKVG